MKCKNCGAELDANTRFCGKCGTVVEAEAKTKGEAFSKLKHKKWLIAGLSVALLAGGVGGHTLIVNANQRAEYDEAFEMASQFFDIEDYDLAEDYFYQAMDILPKRKEPYIELALLNVQRGYLDELEFIEELAQENLSAGEAEEVSTKAEEAIKRKEEEKLAKLKQSVYEDYIDILKNMLDGRFPTKYGYTMSGILTLDEGISKPFLQYSLKDLNDDGFEELLIKYDGSVNKGVWVGDSEEHLRTMGLIFTFDPEYSKTDLLYDGSLAFTPMTNGYLKERRSSKYLGVPYIYGTSQKNDYVNVVNLYPDSGDRSFPVEILEFDKKFIEENYINNEKYHMWHDPNEAGFPGEFDENGDGLVYRFSSPYGEDERFVDSDKIEDEIRKITGNAAEIDVTYEDVTKDAVLQLQALSEDIVSAVGIETGDSEPDFFTLPEDYVNYAGADASGSEKPEGVSLHLRHDGMADFEYINPNEEYYIQNTVEFTYYTGNLTMENDLYYTADFNGTYLRNGNLELITDTFSELKKFDTDIPDSKMHIYLKGYPVKDLSKKTLASIDKAN